MRHTAELASGRSRRAPLPRVSQTRGREGGRAPAQSPAQCTCTSHHFARSRGFSPVRAGTVHGVRPAACAQRRLPGRRGWKVRAPCGPAARARARARARVPLSPPSETMARTAHSPETGAVRAARAAPPPFQSSARQHSLGRAPDSHAARCARLRWLCGAGSERAAFAPQDLGAAACQLRRRASAVKVAAARRSQAATASSALLLEARADHRPPRPPPSRERNLIPPLHSLPTAAASTPPPAAPRAT